tara:strand:+ start:1513 stop:1770 length:258 start_codon:yes stop_codon:yes gene_type:complete
MIKEFILIYLTITQSGGIGMNVFEETFPSLEMCNRFAEIEFLNNDNWSHRNFTHNFYNSKYRIDISDTVDGNMRMYYSCVVKNGE